MRTPITSSQGLNGQFIDQEYKDWRGSYQVEDAEKQCTQASL